MPARVPRQLPPDAAHFVEITIAQALGTLSPVEARHAPKALYLHGRRELLNRGPRVSVIGSRKASPDGLSRARSLTCALVDHGVVVVSGVAEGIDAAAHMTALDAGGDTIAVIGTPLDQFYPAANRALQLRLGREQLLVSQFPIGSPTTPKNFPMRNRTMALLTVATVIVEAGEMSGTRHQGWEALRLGRTLLLMESLAAHPALLWPRQMIERGARVLTRKNLDAEIADLSKGAG